MCYDHIDLYSCVIYPRQKCPGNLVLFILEYTGILFLDYCTNPVLSFRVCWHHSSVSESVTHDETRLMRQAQTLSTEDRDLLGAYHHSFDDERVDLDLVLSLVYKIHSGSQEGSLNLFYRAILSLLSCASSNILPLMG